MVIDTNKVLNGYKTTVLGLLQAALVGLFAYIQAGHKLDLKDPLLWAAVVIAVKGYYTADVVPPAKP